MPSTALPGDSLKGTAGFKYFPGGSTSVAEAVHTLNWPAELVPQGGASYRTNKFRSPVQSLDLEHREVWTIGSGREEATLRLRFDDWPDSLLDMLKDAADGVTLDYYPRLASTNLFFPVHVLDAEGRISEDADRFAQAEYEADLRLRDASSDRQGFWWLKNDNKLKNPRLARGTTGGVPEDWIKIDDPDHTALFSIDSERRAFHVDTVGATTLFGESGIRQFVPGILPGEVPTVSVEARRKGQAGDGDGRIDIRLMSAGSTIVDRTVREVGNIGVGLGVFNRIELSSSAAATTDVVEVQVRLTTLTQSTGDRADMWYRDARLTLS